MDPGDKFRRTFSAKLVKVLLQLKKEGLLPSDLFEADVLAAIGGAFCDDEDEVRKIFCPKVHIHSVDPDFAPYKEISDIEYTKAKIQDLNPDIFDGDIVLGSMGHVAQEYFTDEEKVTVLRATGNALGLGAYLIVTEEFRDFGWKGKRDRLLHYCYNPKGLINLILHLLDWRLIDGYWLKDSIEEYEDLFREAGYEVIVSRQYFRETFVSILRFTGTA